MIPWLFFFSSEYKKIIDNRDITRGVYQEYQLIKPKHHNESDSIIEVLIKGSVKNSVTEEFGTKIVADFFKGNVLGKDKKGSIVVNASYKSEMTNLISTIIRKTTSAKKRKDYNFESQEEIYESLFCDTKSNGKLPKECMYKTNAYILYIKQ